MTINEYAELAMRTQAIKENKQDMLCHGTLGMVSELNEILDSDRDSYEGGYKSTNHIILEIGDLCWFMMEICKGLDIDPSDLSINQDISIDDKSDIARHRSVSSECSSIRWSASRIAGMVQKTYQGREIDKQQIINELSHCINCVEVMALMFDSSLEDVWIKNINKLKARFPKGFDTELDAHRKEGDL